MNNLAICLIFVKMSSKDVEFFTEYGESNRYKILEIIGKGSYGVVCASIKLLRLLRHPDIVEIKRIMLSPSRREFKDIYVVFELMESDLHQVIKANDDLTHEHHRIMLQQDGIGLLSYADLFTQRYSPPGYIDLFLLECQNDMRI
ncbi:hypothetical protein L6452_22588 [Arctium lappa]|uniref:Uncharacterized protein n=1 Tax=Arctium lappa TaxID=4217 RepID=A0ACB9B0J7_ARCLA|nr:hypothetical protein L6452_22588 [Arctium lappa]